MFVCTTDYIPNANYQILGLVTGNIAYAKHIGKDIMAGFKNLAGGEIRSYTELLAEARGIAEQRMMERAAQLGADGVIGMRLSSDTIAEGTIEVVAYGTAVKMIQ